MKLKLYIFISIVLFSACQGNKQEIIQNTSAPSVSNTPQSEKTQKVGVLNPSARNFESDISIIGSAMPNKVVDVYAMEGGYITSLKYDIGDNVKKGAVIAQLANPELHALLKNAEAKVKMKDAVVMKEEAEQNKWMSVSQSKKRILDRLQLTAQKASNLILAADVDEAQADYDLTNANAIAASAMIKVAKAEKEAALSQLSAIQTRVNMLAVKAPFSGLITKRYVDNGAIVQNGLSSNGSKPIVTVEDISKIRVLVKLPESDAQNIKVGSELTLSFSQSTSGPIKAKVSRSAGSLDATSKTMQIEIDLDNSDSKIKPGMFANIQLNAKSRNNILSLPINAKKLINDVAHIMVVENNRVKAIPLQVGMQGKNHFEVLNHDITAQTQVIVQGKNLISDGQAVTTGMMKNQ